MAQTKNNTVIQLKDLKKRFGIGDAEHYALRGIDLTIKKGEFVAIMGPSGCGKTTLLNILGLLDRASDGEYLLDGRSVEDLSSHKQAAIRSKNIGIIFQNFNLVPRMSVIENVALPLTYKGMSKTKRLTRASEVLKAFHLSEREYYMPWQLSGGQTQRVAIARALVNEPSIILADEPTGNLDSKASHIIMEELSDLHAQGNTIIMVTHNPNLTAYASRVIHMADGRIESDTSQHKAPSAPVYGRPLGGKKPKADEETEDSSAPTTQPTDAVLESTKSIQPVRRSMAKTRVRVKKVKIKNVRKRDRK
ncbi:ABC transporter ATP-binding protein [Candidatus Saccharibacteria bacterium]|nr:ABC transporter ATP-binding protein [Candidatus Saccharibacteria bacterium]